MGRKRPAPASVRRSVKTDIAGALFTATQQKVLQLIFGNPERSYFASELIELVDGGSGAVQRELARLAESGLVTQKLIGRQRHYQANSSSPIFEELRKIVAKTTGIPDYLQSVIAPLGSRAKLALIYGSIAKGESSAGSDIDVLIVGDDILLEELYSLLEPAERKLRRKINPTLYSQDEFSRRRKNRNSFVAKVLGGPIVPLVGSVDALEATR